MHRFLRCGATLRTPGLRLVLSDTPAGPPGWGVVRPASPGGRWVSTSWAARAEAPPRRPGDEPRPPPVPGPPADPHTPDPEPDPLQDTSVGLISRFKRTFKQYGKVMIPVHMLTSSAWFGTFYYAAMKGVNLVPSLQMIGVPGEMVDLLEQSQGGYALTAYVMYKIATPARYTVTLGGTSLVVKYLRRKGHMSTPPPVKEYLQDKMEATRGRISERMGETKGRLSERMGETKDKFAERLQETKDRVSFRKKAE